jgi:large subunit ribosomal protein L32
MATPKKKKSLERRRRAWAHQKAILPNISTCKNCGNPHLPHHMCTSCGFYKGICILEPKVRKTEE